MTLKNKFDHLIVHVSATPPSMSDVDAQWIDRAHRRRGWSGCGYHAVILRDGGHLEDENNGSPYTRAYDRTGAHVGGCGPGWNARSLGVCLIGGVKEDGHTPENNMEPEQFDTLLKFIRWATAEWDIPMDNVMGHRDLIKITGAAPKACPCFSVAEFLTGHQREWAMPIRPRPPIPDSKDLMVPEVYTVKPGDTLWEISKTFGVPLNHICDTNRLSTDMIPVGLEIRLR